MHNPESILENETHEVLWDFEIQTDYLILAKRPDLMIAKLKDKLPNSGLRRSDGPPSKIKRKRKE